MEFIRGKLFEVLVIVSAIGNKCKQDSRTLLIAIVENISMNQSYFSNISMSRFLTFSFLLILLLVPQNNFIVREINA